MWPKHEPYLMMFEQTKAIRLADTSLMVAPAIALITVWLQIHYLGTDSLNTAIAMSLLILSIPTHGFFQLGQQAERRLPKSMQSWFRELEEKMDVQIKVVNRKPNSRLTFMDLATLLNRLFNGNVGNKKAND